MARNYEMSSRNQARQRTREAILDAAAELFEPAYFDQVTLADVARHAGVSQQTVVNHFGSKSNLYLTGVTERWVPVITQQRARARPGDLGSVVATVCGDYERTGDATIRTLAFADRYEELAQVVAGGLAHHRAWVRDMFASQLRGMSRAHGENLVTLLAIVLDVRTWFQLRRQDGLDERATRKHLLVLVEATIKALEPG